jgi:hypothetical protein
MIHKPQLSPGRRALVEAAARIQHGCLQSIPFRQGEPDVSRMRVLRDVKLGSHESPRARDCQSTVLKQQFSRLWEILDGSQDGRIVAIEIQNGLPYRIRYYDSPVKRRGS